jgi:hypothetical protein
MLRNSNNPGRLSVNAGNSALRWHSVFIALVLALTIGSAGQIPPARAAPTGATNLRFELKPYPAGPLTISACELVHFDVNVSKEEQVVLFGNKRPVYSILSGVVIKGSVQNSNIGTLSPPKNWTGFEPDDTASASFTFTPKNAGETTITFKATVGTYWVGDAKEKNANQIEVPDKPVQVTVTPCKFKVTTISRSSAGPYNAEGIGDEAEVVADAQGNFKGSTTVNWEIVNTTSCVFSLLSLTPSQVDWSGTIDSDQLALTGTFQPTTTSYSFTCPGIPGGDSGQHTNPIEPLSIRVALTGGASTQAQMVSNAAGSAVIVVIPEDCSGTASC